MKIAFITFLTMLAFAANSVFCRLALSDSYNTPVAFTIIRLLSAALTLAAIFLILKKEKLNFQVSDLIPSSALLIYALLFSVAYVNINTGAGALILFASVQFVMIGYSCLQGSKLTAKEILGLVISFVGFICLFLPKLAPPPLWESFLMMLSGVAWGVYSIVGKKEKRFDLATTKNFILTLPILALLFIVFPFQMSLNGYIWASLSGILTSALGYIIWYKILGDLKTTTAAIVQLSVPVLAAILGAIFLNEELTLHFLISSFLILLGIFVKTR